MVAFNVSVVFGSYCAGVHAVLFFHKIQLACISHHTNF